MRTFNYLNKSFSKIGEEHSQLISKILISKIHKHMYINILYMLNAILKSKMLKVFSLKLQIRLKYPPSVVSYATDPRNKKYSQNWQKKKEILFRYIIRRKSTRNL